MTVILFFYIKEKVMSDSLTRFAEYVWPVLRHFTNNPKRCECCLNYVSEDESICNECKNYSPQKAPPRWPFVINKNDNLLILLSGGKDCVFILGELRRMYPNVLIECMLVDTGFLGPSARKNAEHAANNTHTPLLIDDSHKRQFRQTLRDAFLQLKHDPRASTYGVVDYAEGNLVFDIGIRHAKKHSQRIVSGLTTSQLAMIDAPVKNVPEALFPLDQWRPKEEVIIAGAKALVRDECSFEPLQTNSTLIPLMLTVDILRLGYCGFEREFSRNIREGLADRTTWRNRFDALKWLTESGKLDSKISTLLQSLGLKRKDVLP